MMTRLMLVLAAGMAIVNPVAAQRPDFAGEWVRVDSTPARSVAATGDAGFRRGDMGSGWGAMLGITQRPDTLVVEYAFFSTYDLQPPIRLAFAIDGSESRNTVMIGHSEYAQRSRLSWQGGTLVITTQHTAPKGKDGRAATAEVRQSLTIDAGGVLIVETARDANSVRTTYRRK